MIGLRYLLCAEPPRGPDTMSQVSCAVPTAHILDFSSCHPRGIALNALIFENVSTIMMLNVLRWRAREHVGEMCSLLPHQAFVHCIREVDLLSTG